MTTLIPMNDNESQFIFTRSFLVSLESRKAFGLNSTGLFFSSVFISRISRRAGVKWTTECL